MQEEPRRTYWPKCCEYSEYYLHFHCYNNEDRSSNIQTDKISTIVLQIEIRARE